MKLIFKNKHYKIPLLSFLVFVFIVALDINRNIFAVDANNFVVVGLNPILGGLKNVLLHMATIVDSLLNYALAYDNFFSVGVNAGWETIRDFANLFFALILLFMSIATVLDIGALSNYSAKRMLPNFIAIVILINFSKSIVGIFVDISQIIMLEFYNAILSGGGNGLADVIAQNTSITAMNNRTWWQTLTGVGAQDELFTNLTTIFLVMTMIMTTLWIALSLWVRVVKIWLAIMLSPLAFMAFLLPPIKSVWGQWLSSLQSALVEGPMMLLYIYLGVVVLRASGLSTVASGQFDVASYALTIIIFIMARMKAEEAAQQAPAFAKSLVNTVGSVATLGLGKTVGAGGNMNTGDLFKRGKDLAAGGVKNIDKGVGGFTRGLQVISGGKWRSNDQYELAKKNQQQKIDSGKYGGIFKGAIQQTSEKGRQTQQEDTELRELQRRLNDPNGEKLSSQEMSRYNSLISKKTDEIKDNSFNQHAMDMLDAVKRGETAMVQAIANAGATDLKAFEKALKAEDSTLKNLSMPEILSKLYTNSGIQKGSKGYRHAFNKVSSISKGQKSSAAKEIQAISSLQNDPDQSVRDQSKNIFKDDGSYDPQNKNMVVEKLINTDMSINDRTENLTNDPVYIRRFIDVSTDRELSNKRIYDNLSTSVINSLEAEAKNNPNDPKSQAILRGINAGNTPTPTPTPNVPLSSKNIDSFKKNGVFSASAIINELSGYSLQDIAQNQNWNHLSNQDKTDLENYVTSNKTAIGNNGLVNALIKGLR